MSYLHIPNLYKEQAILLFRECFSLEKLHGTSSNLSWKAAQLNLSPGGESLSRFTGALGGDAGIADLTAKFAALGHAEVVVFGEAYGGSQQGMKATYGPTLKFAVFEVKVGDTWLNVENAADVAAKLGLEFVPYIKIPTDLASIDAQRDADSVQAVRNGMGGGHHREGVVLRPLQEFVDSRGERVICKHKRDEFKETATPRPVVDPAKAKVLEEANAIAMEYVTDMRLEHVLQKFPQPHEMNITGQVIKAMTEDVLREAAGEIVDSKEARKAIGERAGKMYRAHVAKVGLEGK